MRRLSLSYLELAGNCLAPFTEGAEWDSDTTNKALEIGNEFHAAACAWINHGIVTETWTHEEAAEYFEVWMASKWCDVDGQAEVTYAYDLNTGAARELGKELNRDYSASTSDEICGTLDLDYPEDDTWVAIDWKSGQQRKLNRHYNKQVRTGAALAAKANGYTKAKAIVVVVNEGGVFEYVDFVDDIEAELAALTSLALDAELTDPDPTPGMHCSQAYCPMIGTCPVAYREVQSLVQSKPYPLATKADIAKTIEQLYMLESQAAAIWAEVDKRVKEVGDIELRNGKSYGQVEQDTESIEWSDKTKEVLKGLGLSVETKTTLTKKAIQDAIKKVALKGTVAKVERETLDSLRDAGVVKRGKRVYLGLK